VTGIVAGDVVGALVKATLRCLVDAEPVADWSSPAARCILSDA